MASRGQKFPFERYARLRYFHGRGVDDIVQEVTSGLGLYSGPLRDLDGHYRSALPGTPRRIALVSGATSKPALNRIDVLVMGDAAAAGMDAAEYVDHFGLGAYDPSTKSGENKISMAVLLWRNVEARRLICGLLLTDATTKEIREAVKKFLPGKTPGSLRTSDITAFRELFWDFTGWSPGAVLNYLKMVPGALPATSALRHGREGLLFRLGLAKTGIESMEMYSRIRDIAFLQLDTLRTSPEKFSPAEFSSAFAVFKAADAEVRNLAEALDEDFGAEVQRIKMQEIKDFENLDDVLYQAHIHSDRGLVQEAVARGIITNEEGDDLLVQVDNGMLLEEDERVRLRIEVYGSVSSAEEGEDTPDATALNTELRKAQ
jgi:hypothetical protein